MSTQPIDPAAPPLSPDQERLERYLDGVLAEPDRAAFEAELAGSAQLRAEVESHRRLCGALTALASPPAAGTGDGGLRLAGGGAQRASARRHRLVKVGAIAASIGVVGAGAVWYFAPRPSPEPYKPPSSDVFQAKHRKLILEEYQKQLASGFKPAEVCTTDEEFIAWTSKSLGHGLKPVHGAVAAGTPEPQLAGWSRSTTFSAYTGLLLASADGKPVMVVMDQAPPDRMVPPEDASGSPRMFRRKVNDVWLIEVTPLDKPHVINRIEAAS